ncbi:nucleolar protein [Kickxella alabastrina]|uniref:Nucleolar protein n=1 Tax=Kickxella alabastrina TaxID=61397 RepID=A0ACC1I6Q8_9FUNG|nr:nucleolar protein [Kickxella alabastrina]
MAPGRNNTAGKRNAQKAAPKAAPKAALKAAPKPIQKAVPNKKKGSVTQAPIDEDMSDSEIDEDNGSDIEETIYEMSDDSAIEDVSDSGEEDYEEEEEDNISGDDEDIEAANEDSEGSDSEIDEAALLAGIKDSDISESESEGEDDFSKNVGKIELDSKASAKLMDRLSKIKSRKGKPGVLYIGRIPHGFYEEEMHGYFGQFGDIKRLRLSRSPKTGGSRHYAFLEFAHAEVAKIVADTMNNYLMFDRLLKCSVVPEDKVDDKLFTCRFRKVTIGKAAKKQQEKQNRPKTMDEVNSQIGRLVKSENKKRSRLAAAGIDYEFPGYKELRAPKAKYTKFAA